MAVPRVLSKETGSLSPFCMTGKRHLGGADSRTTKKGRRGIGCLLPPSLLPPTQHSTYTIARLTPFVFAVFSSLMFYHFKVFFSFPPSRLGTRGQSFGKQAKPIHPEKAGNNSTEPGLGNGDHGAIWEGRHTQVESAYLLSLVARRSGNGEGRGGRLGSLFGFTTTTASSNEHISIIITNYHHQIITLCPAHTGIEIGMVNQITYLLRYIMPLNILYGQTNCENLLCCEQERQLVS